MGDKENPFPNQFKINHLQEAAFRRLLNFLNYKPLDGLGRKRVPAKVNLEINREHFQNLPLEIIYRPPYPKLHMILNDLIDNCGDHAVREGQDLEITITSLKDEKTLQFTVDDNGPGIPWLSELEVNASKLVSKDHSNLSSAFRGVKFFGGTIRVKNRMDESGMIKGVQFRVIVPDPEKPAS